MSNKFFSYSSGIIDPADSTMCPNVNGTNHAVVAVGYKLAGENSYIEFKNSWGSGWGDNGFFKFKFYNV